MKKTLFSIVICMALYSNGLAYQLSSCVLGIGQADASSANYRHMGTLWQTASSEYSGLTSTSYKADIGYWNAYTIDPLGVAEEEKGNTLPILPKVFSLSQNYPNPANGKATIKYQLPKQTNVCIKVYNLSGQLVKEIINTAQAPGFYHVAWDGKDNSGKKVSAGVYLYRMVAGDFIATKKMVVLR